jgi:hypothetical protein
MNNGMKNLFNENIQCTDPDRLQFCLPVSKNKFWYCEPNVFNETLILDTPQSRIYRQYLGHPEKMMDAAKEDKTVKAFMQNRLLWLNGKIDIRDFDREEEIELLADYGYHWEDFGNDADRNQLLCEHYFESYPMEFRNDI